MGLSLGLRWHAFWLDRRVRRYGWTGMYIGDYRTAPTWAYTIGFDDTLDHPEIIVFDVPEGPASRLFEEAFRQIKDGSLVLEDGMIWPADEERPCAWRKVHPSQIDSDSGWFTFAQVRRFQRTGRDSGLEAFQYVLSDPSGRLPWQEGYDEALRPLQPALYLPADEAG
jgi:hypothetical protein